MEGSTAELDLSRAPLVDAAPAVVFSSSSLLSTSPLLSLLWASLASPSLSLSFSSAALAAAAGDEEERGREKKRDESTPSSDTEEEEEGRRGTAREEVEGEEGRDREEEEEVEVVGCVALLCVGVDCMMVVCVLSWMVGVQLLGRVLPLMKLQSEHLNRIWSTSSALTSPLCVKHERQMRAKRLLGPSPNTKSTTLSSAERREAACRMSARWKRARSAAVT